MAAILIVEDDRNTRRALCDAVLGSGHRVEGAADGESALTLMRREEFDLALCDLMLPGMDGLAFMERGRLLAEDCTFLIMTGFGSVDSAVKAMRRGAYDYLTKPLRMRDVKRSIAKALEMRALKSQVRSLESKLEQQMGNGRIIGKSHGLRRALDLAKHVAPTRSTVLLTGESGTGKDLLAAAIHRASPRAAQRFVKVNCAALPETLLESELFGHKKGAFTGATRDRQGRFLVADKGTLFLDEVGDLSPAMQAKLLRVLQEGEFEMVGGSDTVKVDVRLVAATNIDLKAAIAEKRFREDLYYRLNVISIHLPPLRERRGDIPLLVHHFIKKFSAETEKPLEGITSRAMASLVRHSWPGNLRELENAIQHAVVMAHKPLIDLPDLPADLPHMSTPAPDPQDDLLIFPLGTPIEEMAIEAIRRTIDYCGGNKEEAAARLGISLATLYRKLQKMAAQDSASPPGES